MHSHFAYFVPGSYNLPLVFEGLILCYDHRVPGQFVGLGA